MLKLETHCFLFAPHEGSLHLGWPFWWIDLPKMQFGIPWNQTYMIKYVFLIESLPIHELNISKIVCLYSNVFCLYEVAVAWATVCLLDESKQNFRGLRYRLPHDVLPRTSPWVDRKLTCQLQSLHSLSCSFLTVDAGISISHSIFLPCQHGSVIMRPWPVHILINSMSQEESERGNSGSPAEVEANVTPHV